MPNSITNPNNVFGQIVDASNYFCIQTALKNTGATAIAVGDGVALKYTASGTLLECEEWDTNASGQTASIGVGVAAEAIAINASGLVTVFGYARGNVASGTAAEGDLACGSTTAGVLTPTVADATTIAGTAIGVFLGVKDANNLAPLWVSPR